MMQFEKSYTEDEKDAIFTKGTVIDGCDKGVRGMDDKGTSIWGIGVSE